MSNLKEIFSDKDRRRGLISTILVHLLLLVALFFLALRTPLPLPGEEGVEVNLGYTDTGSGDVQSDTPPPQADPTPPPQPKQKAVEPEPVPQVEENLTQDIEEAPVLEEKEEEEPPEEIIEEPKEEIEEEPVKEEVIEEEPEEETVDSTFVVEEPTEVVVEEPKNVVIQKAMYGGSSKSTEGTNQGVTEGSGDQGKPQGAKDSDKYDGKGGQGDGISYSLGGRGSKELEEPSNDFSESGVVVIRIEVDRSGKVLSAIYQQKNSTAGLYDEKVKLAVEAAKNSTFIEDLTAPEKQRGTITYKFIK